MAKRYIVEASGTTRIAFPVPQYIPNLRTTVKADSLKQAKSIAKKKLDFGYVNIKIKGARLKRGFFDF